MENDLKVSGQAMDIHQSGTNACLICLSAQYPGMMFRIFADQHGTHPYYDIAQQRLAKRLVEQQQLIKAAQLLTRQPLQGKRLNRGSWCVPAPLRLASSVVSLTSSFCLRFITNK